MNGGKKSQITLDDFKIFDERAARGIAVAAAIDNGTPLPYSVTVTTHRFDDFLDALTPERLELLKLAKAGTRSIAELAAVVQRDPKAVSRDIAKLVDLGLVSVVLEPNAGHGVKQIVRPVAQQIEISTAAP